MPPATPARGRRRRRLAAAVLLAATVGASLAAAAPGLTRASTHAPDTTAGGECELWVAKAGEAPVYGSCEGG